MNLTRSTVAKSMQGAIALSDYQIAEQLYAGSRTLVYRAVREIDHQPVVIKLLKNEHPSFSELVQFRNQFAITTHLEIPGIIQPYGLEPYRNGYALVMEDFGGTSLREWMKQKIESGWGERGAREAGEAEEARDGIVSPAAALVPTASIPVPSFFSIALQLVDILHQLHQQRIIHKDLKPANILIHPETQQVKLIDFSIASLLPRETQEIQNPNVLEGTLAYLSPEQTGRMNRGIDYRSDFYSLGVTFFELLTGQLPFQSHDPMEVLHCHLAKQPSSVCDLNSAVPLMLGEIVRKLMAKNAEDRYQSAIGLKYDLVKCQEEWQSNSKHTWFELGQRDVSDRFLIPEKLYGREQEVHTLLEAFGRVANGATELMLVAGFSGIGKTAVVNEVHKPIVRWNGYFIRGKYDQFQRNIPFSAFVQAFRDLMVQLLGESDAKLEQWQSKIVQAVGENGQVLIDVIPELERIIGKQPAVPELSGTATQNRFNLALQQFIQVFTTSEHPLVMFLDDLQWADSASLSLMKLLLSENNGGYLFIIGAYRDNEVLAAHALMLTLGEIAKAKASLHTLTLTPLSLVDVNRLIADTLSCPEERALPLTELVYQKAKGNPFFTTQFLKALHEDGLISFDQEAGFWQCDVAQVRQLAIADDVVEFMALQLQKLPNETQAGLKLAACLGAEFDLETLAIASEQSALEVATALWKAIQEGVIIPTSEVYKFYQNSALSPQNSNLSDVEPSASKQREACPTDSAAQRATQNCSYRFLHDRVQQAAYSLIAEEHRPSIHLKIGQQLLNHPSSAIERDNKLFDIVNHLNRGSKLVIQPAEQAQIARLNLLAAKKARSATAYESAMTYATMGITLLRPDCWQSQYELALELHELAAENAFLSRDFEQMEHWAETVLQQAKIPLDQVKIYEIKIQTCISQHQPLAAIALGKQVLSQFGIQLPDHPDQEDIQQAFQQTVNQFAGRPIEALVNLPPMTASEPLAVIRIAASTAPAVYFAAPPLYPFLILSQVNASIQYGNAPLSAFFYASYGLLLNGILEDMEAADRAGKLALGVLEKLNAREVECQTRLILGALVVHGTAHLQTCLQFLRESYQSGLETGELEFAGHAAFNSCQYSYFIGQELGTLEQDLHSYSQMLTNLKQVMAVNYCQLFRQVALNLLGKAKHPQRLVGDRYDEAQAIPQLLAANDLMGLHFLYLHKLILSYLFGDTAPSLSDIAAQGRQYLAGGTGFITVPLFYFYDSLAALTGDLGADSELSDRLKRVAKNQATLQKWAHHAPMNYLHKWHLVEAEKHRVLGNRVEATDQYDRAIAGAEANEYIQEAALANELAAKFYLEWHKQRIAQEYLTEAYYGYARWGAKAKLADLEQRYPQLLAPILQQTRSALSVNETVFAAGSVTSTSASSSNISDALDLAAILKASQTLSSEIQLDQLLSTLLHTIIQMAGADKCVLMLVEEEQLMVFAEAVITASNQIKVQVQQPQTIQASREVPVTLINRVKRSLQPAVIAHAVVHPQFANDAYIQTRRLKSLLCSPIIHQGKLLGIVYLENNSILDAFTRDRVELLNLLCAQAAISLENARLYERSQQYAQQLEQKTQALENVLNDLQSAQIQIVQSEKMSALGNLVAGVAHEINNPVGFIAGNLQPAIDYVKDTFGLLDLYQQEYPHPSAVIQDAMEAIDLDYVRDDLPRLIGSMQLGVDRIRSISTSLRTFSRADKDYKVPFNLHEGIDSTILILKHRLKANALRPDIEVVTHYGKIPAIQCFPGQLNQVFMNILANAIDAVEEANQPRSFAEIEVNPNRIEIQTQWDESQKHVIIQIRDNGIGMADAVKQHVFDHLFTTKAVGKGTGLGLAIARQIIIEKHGGSIAIDSAVGQGTEFTIQLPIALH